MRYADLFKMTKNISNHLTMLSALELPLSNTDQAAVKLRQEIIAETQKLVDEWTKSPITE